MNKKFLLIGGDLRTVKLTKMLLQDGHKVYTYGLEKSQELKEEKNICIEDIEKASLEAEIIIGPIPFSKNGIEINTPLSDMEISIQDLINISQNKVLIAGSISQNVYDIAKEKNVKIIDIMKREELAILNAISTAEGTIEILISKTNKIIHGSNILILGYGRIGKVLSKKLQGLSVNVTCAARKLEDFAWIEANGYKSIDTTKLDENLKDYDVIVNTVPKIILTEKELSFVDEECLLIDLASSPGGFDQAFVEERNLNYVWALALPGKVAAVSSAGVVKSTIYNVI